MSVAPRACSAGRPVLALATNNGLAARYASGRRIRGPRPSTKQAGYLRDRRQFHRKATPVTCWRLRFKISQLTDVSDCKLQHCFPCNRHRAQEYRRSSGPDRTGLLGTR